MSRWVQMLCSCQCADSRVRSISITTFRVTLLLAELSGLAESNVIEKCNARDEWIANIRVRTG